MTDKFVTVCGVLRILFDCFCKWLRGLIQETGRWIVSLVIK